MTEKFRYYRPCDTCNGTGIVDWETIPGTQSCPTCVLNKPYGVDVVVFDGLRHVYAGILDKVKDEE